MQHMYDLFSSFCLRTVTPIVIVYTFCASCNHFVTRSHGLTLYFSSKIIFYFSDFFYQNALEDLFGCSAKHMCLSKRPKKGIVMEQLSL